MAASGKIVNIFCAQPIGDEEIAKVTIQIHAPVPDMPHSDNWAREYHDMYTKEGQKLADALCYSLPGGTIDALLIRLLEEKRNLFKVPLYVKLETQEEKAKNGS